MRGLYTPKHPHKYRGNVNKIVYRSSWERLCMIWIDYNSAIVAWNSEGIRIPYICGTDNRAHKYHVDFWIQVKRPDGTTKEALLEVKPEKETVPPVRRNQKDSSWRHECLAWIKNQAKWAAARKFCAERGLDFYIITERTLKLGKYTRKR